MNAEYVQIMTIIIDLDLNGTKEYIQIESNPNRVKVSEKVNLNHCW